METLLIFLAIIALQMAAAYFKQKKNVKPLSEPGFSGLEDFQDELEEVPSVLPEVELPKLEVQREQVIITEEKICSQFNVRDPRQGILWNAILREPRFRVKWSRR